MADQTINPYMRRGSGPAARPAAAAARPRATDKPRYGWLIALFYVSIMLPVLFNVGPFTLPPYRLLLLLTLIPSMFVWISGAVGKIRAVDLLLIAFTLWASMSLFVVHGVGRAYQQVGFTIIETLGAYFLGRMIVRNAADFARFSSLHIFSLYLMLPLALIETQTGDPLVITLLQPFIQTLAKVNYEPRLGLERAQVLFQHPIVYGVYSAAAFGVVIAGLKPLTGIGSRAIRSVVIVVSTVCSVSSGALVALLLQWMFMGYDWVLRNMPRRWTMAGIAFAILYVIIDIVSNRPPIQILVSYMALDPSTAWNRLLIFDYGTQNIARHPLFGIGMNDWVRARWMSSSIDNYWLVLTMRHGIPALVFLMAAILIFIRQLARKELHDPVHRAMRAGILISLGAVSVSAGTVHLWGPIVIWFYFFIGAGIWILDVDDAAGPANEEASEADPDSAGSRFSRYGARHVRPKKGAIR